jgi:putative ABC transport system permease protein
MATTEISMLESIADTMPVVFLGVSAFLIYMVLGRLITLQRPELATLKAVGYTNREVAAHYLGLVVVVMVPAGALGIAGGWYLGGLIVPLYGTFFHVPDFSFRMTAGLVSSALLVSMVAAAAGALLAVRRAVTLPPAEAMRPPAPPHYGRGLMERLGLSAVAGNSGLMVVREIERRPLRTFLSALGMAGAIALVVFGHFGTDSFDAYVDGTLRREQRQDLSVAFARPLAERAVGYLARRPGVTAAEGLRVVPVHVRYGARTRDSALVGLPDGATLRQLVTRAGGTVVGIPDDGVLMTKTLGDILGLGVGDRVDLELREGDRSTVRPVVAGFVDETTGLQVYAHASLVASLEKDLGAVSSVLLKVEPSWIPALEAHLRRLPSVVDVSDIMADVRRMQDMNAQILDIRTAIMVTFAVFVVFGVVYNNARIALQARARDLATLRVLGMSRGEISSILIGSLAVEVALSIPIGLWLGRAWAVIFMGMADQETFRWAVVVPPRTYLLSAAVALVAAAASALWVRRSLDKLDLVAVLKARE